MGLEDRYTEMLVRLPIVSDWCEYKGEIYFTSPNYEATKKAGKPMLDLSYCATRALNNIVLKTVQWDKKKFRPSHLSNDKNW